MLYVVDYRRNATGKSQATNILKDLGYLVIDADYFQLMQLKPSGKEIVEAYQFNFE